MAELTVETLAAKVDSLVEKLSANEEQIKKDKDDNEKMSARLVALKSAMEHMTKDEKMAMKKGIENGDDEEMKKAMKKAMEDMPEDEKKGKKGMEDKGEKKEGNEDDEKEMLKAKNKTLTAIVTEYQKGRSTEIIEQLAALKGKLIPDLDLEVYKTALKAKKFEVLMAEFDSRKDEIAAMTAAEKEPEKKHFGFGLTASAKQSSMTKVSDIMNGGGIN